MVSQAAKKAAPLDGAPLPLLKVISRQTLRQILSVDEGRLTLALKRERQQPSALPVIADIATGVTCATEARRPGMFGQRSSRRGLMPGFYHDTLLPTFQSEVSAYDSVR